MGTFLSRNEFPCSLTQQAEAVIKELGDGCSTFPKLNPRVITASQEHPALWCGTNGMVLSTWCDWALNHLGITWLSLYSMDSVLLPVLQMCGTHNGSNPPQIQHQEVLELCNMWE